MLPYRSYERGTHPLCVPASRTTVRRQQLSSWHLHGDPISCKRLAAEAHHVPEAGSSRQHPPLRWTSVFEQLKDCMTFESLGLSDPLLRAVKTAGYQQPTAIQEKVIPKLLAGRDLVGCAQTGTGKTAAFTLPTLHRLVTTKGPSTGANRRRQRSGKRVIRALILSPTRELASQIGDSLATYGKHSHLRHCVVYGGVRQGPQVRALQAGVDVLVATPGRLLDLIGQGFIHLDRVEMLILDEADQMLDMGFIHDLRKIVARVPETRQTMMFSATMPRPIRELAEQWLRRPLEVKVAPVASTPTRLSQSVVFVERQHKTKTLIRILNQTPRSRTLIFSRTKHGADKLARCLHRDGIRAVAIHGNKSQSQRQAAIREFNSTRPPVLVATDLAARGLDFLDISHVINYDMPDAAETYVHRIGRTARAGATGQAISFCGRDERKRLRVIEKLTGQRVTIQQPPNGEQKTQSTKAPSTKTPSKKAKAAQSTEATDTDSKRDKVRPRKANGDAPRGKPRSNRRAKQLGGGAKKRSRPAAKGKSRKAKGAES